MAEINSLPLRWVKSSYSTHNGGSCVEWAPDVAVAGVVPVRDSKDLAGPVLSLPVDAFSSFVAGVKGGEFGAV
ncbi:DUF397 domain-containing protein [Streptomyces sp. NPDC049906]|uniref:DUF397 domain-containing protein n=1 Tax=Streptomyces sp. NPDC049906 TaxID=3155656 RepID=UPI00342C54A2